MVTIKAVLHFMDVQYGDDIVIVSWEHVGNDVRVIWHEVGDDEHNFSVVGYSKFGYLTEKVCG